MSEFRLGFREKELLWRLREGPTPARVYPDGLNRSQRQVYSRALRRLQRHGLAHRFPHRARSGRGSAIESSLTTEGVAVREALRAQRKLLVERASLVSEKLYDWQTPKTFKRRETRLNRLIDAVSRIGADDWAHRERIFRDWREAWVLGHVFEELNPESVRLVRAGDGRPDAELRICDDVLPFEITEALPPGQNPRQRGLPFPESDGGPSEWRARAMQVPGLVETAIARKRTKPYAREANLLVYVSMSGSYGLAMNEVAAEIARLQTQHDGATFRALRVLWSGRVF